MNEAIKNIDTRRSVKSFSDRMPTEEDIDTILRAGINAASGRNLQSSILIAIKDKEVRDRLMKTNAEILGASTDPFYGAPVIIAVLAKKSVSTHIYDGSLSLGNMMLAAHSLGLGSCWIHRARETFERKEWQEFLRSLGLDEEYEGIGNLALGYPSGDPLPEKPRREGRIFIV